MGLQTCVVPSPNGLHTIHCESKFVSFLREQRELGVPCVPYSPQVRGKLIYHASSANRLVRMCVLVLAVSIGNLYSLSGYMDVSLASQTAFLDVQTFVRVSKVTV